MTNVASDDLYVSGCVNIVRVTELCCGRILVDCIGCVIPRVGVILSGDCVVTFIVLFIVICIELIVDHLTLLCFGIRLSYQLVNHVG